MEGYGVAGSVDADMEASRVGSDPGLRKGRSYCP